MNILCEGVFVKVLGDKELLRGFGYPVDFVPRSCQR